MGTEIWVAQLLSVFGGFLGLDRFYMGQIWQPVLKICTLNGLGIWYIVDVLILAIEGVQLKTKSIINPNLTMEGHTPGFWVGVAILSLFALSTIVTIITTVVAARSNKTNDVAG
jgi:hypothetical protein